MVLVHPSRACGEAMWRGVRWHSSPQPFKAELRCPSRQLFRLIITPLDLLAAQSVWFLRIHFILSGLSLAFGAGVCDVVGFVLEEGGGGTGDANSRSFFVTMKEWVIVVCVVHWNGMGEFLEWVEPVELDFDRGFAKPGSWRESTFGLTVAYRKQGLELLGWALVNLRGIQKSGLMRRGWGRRVEILFLFIFTGVEITGQVWQVVREQIIF